MAKHEKKAEEEREKAPIACEGCIKWERFGKNCYVFWENKKICTRKAVNVEELMNEPSL